MRHVPISHQTGAKLSTLPAHMIESTAVIKLERTIHMANEHTPTFQDWNMLLDNDSSTSMQARKLAIGTSGYAISRVMLRVTGYTIEGGSDLQMHIRWVLFIMDLSQGIIAGRNVSHPR